MLSFYFILVSLFIFIYSLLCLPICTPINLRLLRSIQKWHRRHYPEIVNKFQIIRVRILKKNKNISSLFSSLIALVTSVYTCKVSIEVYRYSSQRGDCFFPGMIFYSVRHHRLPPLLIGPTSIIVTYCWSWIGANASENGGKCINIHKKNTYLLVTSLLLILHPVLAEKILDENNILVPV